MAADAATNAKRSSSVPVQSIEQADAQELGDVPDTKSSTSGDQGVNGNFGFVNNNNNMAHMNMMNNGFGTTGWNNPNFFNPMMMMPNLMPGLNGMMGK